jgi:hypothetical protein
VFDDLRRALDDLLKGHVPAAERREVLQEMRESLVRARMSLDDLREGVAATSKRLQRERDELEKVRRRRTLAEGIGDAETVTVAQRFEAQHAEKVALIEKKLEAEQGELALAEREVEDMKAQFKAAQAGVGSGLRGGTIDSAERQLDEELSNPDAGLDRELSGLDRARRKAATEAEADARLAELKKRMGH